MRLNILSFIIICCFSNITTHAQDMTKLYAVGDAVPGGIQELTVFPGNQYKYAGSLKKGKLRVRNTPDHKTTTRYLKPTNEDAYIVNNGISYTLSKDSIGAEWVVPFEEDMFRFTVVYTTSTKTLTGELFRPWNELFIVGGATECGWETYTFLPFTRLEEEICTWEWTGELKYREEHGEPRRFKFSGQNAWEPKMLHPFTSDENILNSKLLLTNGAGDNKWSVVKDGYYHIVVDVFRETVNAEYLGEKLSNNSENPLSDFSSTTNGDNLADNINSIITTKKHIEIHDIKGKLIYSGIPKSIDEISIPQRKGIYLITTKDDGHINTYKIIKQ